MNRSVNLNKILEDEGYTNFFNTLDPDKTSLIPDRYMYCSRLFTAFGDRGRKGAIKQETTLQMGLLRNHQTAFMRGLPKHTVPWCADACSQDAELQSPYVIDLINNDAVYVSGPSGMTSLFMGQMECLGNFPTVKQKQHYLAAVTAYMVAGGFHSLHEVLGPAEYALDLVPGYNISVPLKTKLAAPPNFHQFYSLQMQIDPELERVYRKGWNKLIQFTETQFKLRCSSSDNYPLQYHTLWAKEEKTNDKNEQQVEKAKRLLHDYTKNNNSFIRMIHGHFLRNHCDQVDLILKGNFESVDDLVRTIKSEIGNINPKGSLAKRLAFIENELYTESLHKSDFINN